MALIADTVILCGFDSRSAYSPEMADKESEVRYMERKIVGYEKFKSKRGTDCCAISTETAFKPRDGVEQLGIKTEVVMCYGDSCSAIDKAAIGKELLGFFGYSNGVCVVQGPSFK